MLPIMDHTGVPWGFHELKYRKGKGKQTFKYRNTSKHLTRYLKGVPFSIERILPFLSKNCIFTCKVLGRVWNSGQET